MKADLVLFNARIRTLDPANRVAQALAVLNNRFLAVGSSREMRELAGKSTTMIDAAGRTVVPGFIDAHCHPASLRGKQLLQVDLSPERVRSIDDLVKALQAKAAETPPGQWIQGQRYDDTKLAENRHPTRKELDRASREHPIHIRHVSGHLGAVNSMALQLAGLGKGSTAPAGGSFDRDAAGELTGVCREEADFLFLPGIAKGKSLIPPMTAPEERQAVELACREYNRYGITSAGDALCGPAEMDAFQAARSAGALTVRIYMLVLDQHLPHLKALRLRTGFGDEMLRLGAVKSFLDGAIAGRTAWLSRPYEGRPDDFGIPTKTPGEIEQIVMEAHEAGFQVGVHANGDRAIEVLLDVYEKALQRFPRADHRHRICHCTVVTPKILERIKRLGVVVLPFSTYIHEHGEKMGEYGQRISMMFAHRSFLDHGIPVGGSSDNPCATQDPLIALQAMVTRRSSSGELLGPEQRVSAEEALRIYTLGSAYASFEEKLKGSIEPGKLADFVVLSGDPIGVPPEQISSLRVEATYLGGREVYSAARS